MTYTPTVDILSRNVGDIIQPTHLLFILVVALLVLGPKRLPEVGRSLGRGLRDFRQGMQGVEAEARSVFSDAIDAPEHRRCRTRRSPWLAPAAAPVGGTGAASLLRWRQHVANRAGSRGLRRLTPEPRVETAALVALLREGGRAWARYVVAARRPGAGACLGAGSPRAGARAAFVRGPRRCRARAGAMAGTGLSGAVALARRLPGQPPRRREPSAAAVRCRSLSPADRRSVSVIGTRQPSEAGPSAGARGCAGPRAGRIHRRLWAGRRHRRRSSPCDARTAGCGACALGANARRPRHRPRSARTHRRTPSCRPESAARGRVVSQFWPEATPTRQQLSGPQCRDVGDDARQRDHRGV